jgi:hypothetical protein
MLPLAFWACDFVCSALWERVVRWTFSNFCNELRLKTLYCVVRMWSSGSILSWMAITLIHLAGTTKVLEFSCTPQRSAVLIWIPISAPLKMHSSFLIFTGLCYQSTTVLGFAHWFLCIKSESRGLCFDFCHKKTWILIFCARNVSNSMQKITLNCLYSVQFCLC